MPRWRARRPYGRRKNGVQWAYSWTMTSSNEVIGEERKSITMREYILRKESIWMPDFRSCFVKSRNIRPDCEHYLQFAEKCDLAIGYICKYDTLLNWMSSR